MRIISRIIFMVAAIAASSFFAAAYAFSERYADVDDLIRAGKLHTAASKLEGIISRDFIDAEGFYYHALLEPKGDVAIVNLQKSLELCEDEQCAPAAVELVTAFYVAGRYEDAVETYKKYHKKIDYTPENLKFIWLTGMSYMRLGEYKSAEKMFREIQKKYRDIHMSGWGDLGAASVKVAKGDQDDAEKELQPLIPAGGEVSALAIYNNSYLLSRNGDRDSGLFGYNLLHERFGRFIGSDELIGTITGRGSAGTTVGSAEAPDLTFTIEMGVFSDKAEADKLVGRLKAGKWSVDLKSSYSGDDRYWTVRVGIFRSQEAAEKTRKKLESLYPGNYRVVMR